MKFTLECDSPDGFVTLVETLLDRRDRRLFAIARSAKTTWEWRNVFDSKPETYSLVLVHFGDSNVDNLARYTGSIWIGIDGEKLAPEPSHWRLL